MIIITLMITGATDRHFDFLCGRKAAEIHAATRRATSLRFVLAAAATGGEGGGGGGAESRYTYSGIKKGIKRSFAGGREGIRGASEGASRLRKTDSFSSGRGGVGRRRVFLKIFLCVSLFPSFSPVAATELALSRSPFHPRLNGRVVDEPGCSSVHCPITPKRGAKFLFSALPLFFFLLFFSDATR